MHINCYVTMTWLRHPVKTWHNTCVYSHIPLYHDIFFTFVFTLAV